MKFGAVYLFLIFLLNILGKYDILILEKESTHSKVDAPEKQVYLSFRTLPILLADGIGLFFSLVILISCEKGKKRNNQLPKGYQQTDNTNEYQNDICI